MIEILALTFFQSTFCFRLFFVAACGSWLVHSFSRIHFRIIYSSNTLEAEKLKSKKLDRARLFGLTLRNIWKIVLKCLFHQMAALLCGGETKQWNQRDAQKKEGLMQLTTLSHCAREQKKVHFEICHQNFKWGELCYARQPTTRIATDAFPLSKFLRRILRHKDVVPTKLKTLWTFTKSNKKNNSYGSLSRSSLHYLLHRNIHQSIGRGEKKCLRDEEELFLVHERFYGHQL